DERERALVASQSQLTQLAEEAADLEGLITSLSDEVDRIRTEAEQKRLEAEAAARRIEEERIAAVQEAERARLEALQQEEEERQAALQAAENARLAAIQALEESRRRAQALAEKPQIMTPSAPIASRRGQLSRPVAGTLLTRFGTDDGLGNRAQGETIETLANAIVTAPVDGSVLYAGPFRAYGNLLILDAGDGYHIVLAGMDRIEVAQGQFVVAGEPVGIMGSIRLASVAAAAAEKNNPTLYVEFRKDGRPVDASPWWVAIGGQGRT
ncbi:MAG: peptidoglycan DD-metalloendopeptidase family protein, partial [Pseudomonadota bacterium]